MKKTTLFAALLLFVAMGLNAQNIDSLMQPTHVVGLSFDDEGQTVSYPADFEYLEDGKLLHFYFHITGFPENHDRRIYYRYSNDYLTEKNVFHVLWPENRPFTEDDVLQYNDQGRPYYRWCVRYYDDDIWGSSGFYYQYYYDQFNRVTRAEWGEVTLDLPDPYSIYWTYEYENSDKTVVEKKYVQEYHNQAFNHYLNTVTTRIYSDDYTCLSVQVDSYQWEGEITQSTLQSYTYNEQHQLESVTAQLLSDGEWVNSGMTLYAYDDNGHCVETIVKSWSDENNDWVNSTIGTKSFNDEGLITEDFSGTWSEELQDWVPVDKTVFEYENNNTLYIVSFWKYEQDQWVRDTYKSQTMLFGKELELQQDCIETMTYKNLNNHLPKIDYYQFEFTMERLKRPTYQSVEEDSKSSCAVYPNPGKDYVTIKASVLNAVVRFYDLQGRLLLAQPFDFQTDVNAASWTPGIYLWEIWNGPNTEASGKWIKE